MMENREWSMMIMGNMQGIYNPQQVQQSQQYYAQLYGGSTSNTALGGPFYYGGYSLPNARTGFSSSTPAHRIPGPSYLYYPTHMDGAFTPYPAPFPSALLPPSNRHQQVQTSTATEEPLAQQSTSTETDNAAIHSEGPST